MKERNEKKHLHILETQKQLQSEKFEAIDINYKTVRNKIFCPETCCGKLF